jgi:hypothetical protein
VTVQQLLTALFNAGIAISIGATVLSLGMTYTVGQLVAPLHRVVLVIAMVVLNAGVIPALAWGIAEITPMNSKYVSGLVLATLGAGSAAAALTWLLWPTNPGALAGTEVAGASSGRAFCYVLPTTMTSDCLRRTAPHRHSTTTTLPGGPRPP